MVIETEEHAKARGANILARIMGARVPSAGFHMGFGGPMATLATSALRRKVARRNALIVGIFVEIEPDIGVAGLTNFAADIGAGGSLSACRQGRE